MDNRVNVTQQLYSRIPHFFYPKIRDIEDVLWRFFFTLVLHNHFSPKWNKSMGLDWKLTYQLTNVSVQKCDLSEMSIRVLSRLVSNSERPSLLITSRDMIQPVLQKFRNHAPLPCTLLAQLTSHISHAAA